MFFLLYKLCIGVWFINFSRNSINIIKWDLSLRYDWCRRLKWSMGASWFLYNKWYVTSLNWKGYFLGVWLPAIKYVCICADISIMFMAFFNPWQWRSVISLMSMLVYVNLSMALQLINKWSNFYVIFKCIFLGKFLDMLN